MFNIFSHQGNVDQNNTEIASHPIQNDHHQENKQPMLMRTQGKRYPHTLWVAM
jgi:hypothetical protein